MEKLIDRYFFMHIPKTAGTTFRASLYNQFSEHEMFPTKTQLNNKIHKKIYNSDKYLDDLPESVTENVRLLLGHYTFSAGDVFYKENQYFRLTFLRDPIQRVISNIFHLKYISNPTKYKHLKPEEIFELEPNRFTLAYIKFFNGFSVFHNFKNLTQNSFENSIHNLKKFNFIGISEKYAKSIKLVQAMFNWQLGANKHQNINFQAKKERENLDKNFINKLTSVNELDIEFYRFANEIFKSKCDQFKIT